MIPALNLLIGLAMGLNLVALGSSRLPSLIRTVATQGIALGLMPLILEGSDLDWRIISIALARELLQTYKNSTCLVVSTVSRLFFSHFFLRSFLFFLSLALSFSRSLFHLTLSVSLSLFPENQKKKPKKKKKKL